MTKQTKAHTPTPWEALEQFNQFTVSTLASDGVSDICYMNQGLDYKANAEFIVRACNNHDQLLEACKQADKFFSILEPEKDMSYGYQDLTDAVSAITKALENVQKAEER